MASAGIDITRELEHGTRGRYVQGCRCDDCRAANTRAANDRKARARAAACELERPADGICPGVDGEPCGTKLRRDSAPRCARCASRLVWDGMVSARPARAHILALSRKGVGYTSVSEASDVSRSVLFKIAKGERKQIRRSTRDAILDVSIGAAAGGARVPAGPTWRMLEALLPEYLTRGNLALALGYKQPALQIGRKWVLARTELRVRRLYEQHIGRWDRPTEEDET